MVKRTITTILAVFAMLWSFAAHAADTLADMDIAVDPALIAYGIDPGEKHPVAGEPYHAEAEPQFIRQNVGPVVIIGDSIMHLLGQWPGAINLAVSGTTTEQILASTARIPANASRVYIEGGINNYLFGTQARIAPDYAAILAALPRAAHAEVIGILPVNDAQIAANRNVNNALIAATNARIAPLCGAGCSLVPSPFGKSLLATQNVGDGIHPNAAGIAVLAKAISR